MRRKLYFLLLVVLFGSISAFGQSVVKGTIVDKDTKEPLIGVSIFSENSKIGTSTDLDGSFTLRLPSISGNLKITYIGYKDRVVNATENVGTIELQTDAIGLNDVVVTSSIAIRRKTPVALSAIEPEMLEAKLSSQEFPEILKSTPSVYATKQGGGYGDSRVNIRGFESENVAVMVNGVPMNDMEWWGVYWSNWAGLSDVTRSMQVQRGLGAAKVAAPSIGGSINIVTRSTDAKKGGAVQYTLGNDGYNKIMATVSTGLSESGWAMTFLGSKTWGDGYIMGTEFEAYTWFANISKIINDNHQLSLTAFGSPQWHNQRNRNDKLTIVEWQRQKEEYKFNPTYGFDAQGNRVNGNRNRYHKPQISLNHFWTMNEKSSLSSVLYLSIGDGAGYSWQGAKRNDMYGSDNTTGLLNHGYRNPLTGYIDYGKLQKENSENPNGSQAVLSEQRNNHTWVGLLSTYTTKFSEYIDFYGGIDLRYYAGLHDQKITDLMGGDFFVDPERAKITEANWPGISQSYVNQRLKVGDRVYRDNTGYVTQIGVFSQAEYNRDALSVFLSGSISNNTYWKKDRYYYSGSNQKSPTKSFIGFNIKGGANYNLDEHHNVFFNSGYMSRAPKMSGGYFNRIHTSNSVNKDAVNEKSYSFEVGYGYRSSIFSANLNTYLTKWLDKTMVKSYGNDYNAFVNLKGIDARHMGIELDFVFRPVRNLDISGMLSIGDWIWDSKATGYIYDSSGNPSDGNNVVEEFGPDHKPITVDLTDVKVGNSAQTTFNIGANYKFFDALTLGADFTFYANNYADYTIDSPNPGSTYTYRTPWKIPSAGVLDLNARYAFKIGPFDATLYGNINNVLNQEYITDAVDLDARNIDAAPDWRRATVFYGFGRTYTASLKVRF